ESGEQRDRGTEGFEVLCERKEPDSKGKSRGTCTEGQTGKNPGSNATEEPKVSRCSAKKVSMYVIN
ncbi:MAG TPA: hypothetical protein PLU43_06990, partial [Lachnospiraceae bacterium]|nr:hypothetical protein [Lachnospiraceae bacterium]